MRRLNMRKNEAPGFLITFCGLDGCGKTTMMKRLIAELEKDIKKMQKDHRRTAVFPCSQQVIACSTSTK